MILLVNSFQPAVFDVRVNLRSGNTGVAEHFLQRPDIRTACQQMRGKAMPESMRADVCTASDSSSVFFYQLPDHHPRNSRSPSCHEKTSVIIGSSHLRTLFLELSCQSGNRHRIERNNSLLVPFAYASTVGFFQMHVPQSHARHFRCPATRRIQHAQQSPVP